MNDDQIPMTTQDIVDDLSDIQISLAADDPTCWDSPVCPYCMLRTLKDRLKKEVKDE